MIAGVFFGRLYSYDGSSWSEDRPAGNANKIWYACSISGNKMIAGVSGGRLWSGIGPEE
jgi:hypothetical protein